MAILSKLVMGACALASITYAAPVIVTITDTVTVTYWETVNATSTIWPSSESSSASVQQVVAAETTPSAAQIQQTPSPSIIPSSTPAVFVQQVADPVATSISTVATTFLTVAVPRSADVTASTTTTSTTAATTGGSCEGSSAPCTGDVTHWDGGLGACGWSVNTSSDMQIALPVGMMGSQSNGNPYCGRSLTIKNPTTGVTMQATVGDKCMGCTGNSIDLTDVLFNAVTGNGDGRVSGIQWWFN